MCNSHKRSLVTRRVCIRNRDLIAPTVPLADPIDGLLTLEDLQLPIDLSFVAWSDSVRGNEYQLLWNGDLVGATKTIVDEVPGDPLTLTIPADLLINDGINRVGYEARIPLGPTTPSPEVPVIVDRTAPGGSLVAAMIFPSEVNDGNLTSDELSSLGDVLIAEVPGYTGMAWGDHIRTFWGGTTGPAHTVTEEEVTNKRVMISFTRAFLESLGDITQPVYFNVTDRAGNKSIDSQPRTFSLFLKEVPADYPAPLCQQADDGLIDDADARATVAVDIPRYPTPQIGDAITLYWGSEALPQAALEAGDETGNPVLTFNVRYPAIKRAGDGEVALRYEVRRNNVLVGRSLELDVNVNLELPGPQDPDPETPENEALALPIIRGTSGNIDNQDNVIDEDDFLLEANAVIGWKDAFVISDVISLYWGSQATPVTHTIRSTDLNKDLLLIVPNALMVAEGTGDMIKVHYTVTHAGNPNTSRSAKQNVIVRSTGDLPGGADGLQKPVFTQANIYNTINATNSPDGTPIFVAPYENAEKYRSVTMVFRGYNRANGSTPVPGAGFEITHTLEGDQLTEGFNFRATNQQLRLICEGRAEAYYRVEGPNGPVNSTTTDVIVNMIKPGSGC
ncbi:hypothetical protein ACIPL1_23350 [Pseudomonas sp. NPDC090202]|uniref:hypothetical protein n=1 Tax=unclassified Pseudomonas TaxID=196821 RepID=UPI0037F5803A